MRPAAEEEEEQPASEHALLSERTRVRINRRFVKTGKMERLERKKEKTPSAAPVLFHPHAIFQCSSGIALRQKLSPSFM